MESRCLSDRFLSSGQYMDVAERLIQNLKRGHETACLRCNWPVPEKNLTTAVVTLDKYNRGNQEIFIISSSPDGKFAVRTSSHFPTLFIYMKPGLKQSGKTRLVWRLIFFFACELECDFSCKIGCHGPNCNCSCWGHTCGLLKSKTWH